MRWTTLPLCWLATLLPLAPAQKVDFELNRGNSEALAALHAGLKVITSRPSNRNGTDPSWLDLANQHAVGALSPPSDGNCWAFNGPPLFPPRDKLTPGGTLDRWLTSGKISIGAERFSIFATGTKPASGTIIANGTGVRGQSYDLLLQVIDVMGQFYGVKIDPIVWYFDWCEDPAGCKSATPTLLNIRLRTGVIDLAYGGIGYSEARDAYLDYGCFGASERNLVVSGPLGKQLKSPQNVNSPSTLLCFASGSNSITVAQGFFPDAALLTTFKNDAEVFAAVQNGTKGCQGTFQGSSAYKSSSGLNKFEFAEIERHMMLLRQDTRLGGQELASALNAALGETVKDGTWAAKVAQEVTAGYPTIVVTPPDSESCPGWETYPAKSSITKDGLLEKILTTGKIVIGADFSPRLPISGGPDISQVNDGAQVALSSVRGLDHILMQEMLKKVSTKYQATIVPEYRQYRWCQTQCTTDAPELLRRHLDNGHVDIVGGGVAYTDGRAAFVEYPCWTSTTREVIVKGPKAPAKFQTQDDINKDSTIFCVPEGFGSLFPLRQLYPKAQIRTDGILADADDALNKVRDGIFGCMATIDDAVHYGVYAVQRDPGNSTSVAVSGMGQTIKYYSPTMQDGGDGSKLINISSVSPHNGPSLLAALVATISTLCAVHIS